MHIFHLLLGRQRKEHLWSLPTCKASQIGMLQVQENPCIKKKNQEWLRIPGIYLLPPHAQINLWNEPPIHTASLQTLENSLQIVKFIKYTIQYYNRILHALILKRIERKSRGERIASNMKKCGHSRRPHEIARLPWVGIRGAGTVRPSYARKNGNLYPHLMPNTWIQSTWIINMNIKFLPIKLEWNRKPKLKW